MKYSLLIAVIMLFTMDVLYAEETYNLEILFRCTVWDSYPDLHIFGVSLAGGDVNSNSYSDIAAEATLKVYDITGALKRIVAIPKTRAGSIIWDGKGNAGRNLATGIYFCRLEANGKYVTDKVVFLR